MAQITKLFTKGLDTDTAPHLQEKESYSSAMNVHIALDNIYGASDGTVTTMNNYNDLGNDGLLEEFAGNTDWTDLLDTLGVFNYNVTEAKCVGYAVDETENNPTQTRWIYLFLYTPYASPTVPENSWILKIAVEYNSVTNKPEINAANSKILLSGLQVEPIDSFAPLADGIGFNQETIVIAKTINDLLIFTDGVNPQRYLNVNYDYSVFLAGEFTQAQFSLITEPPQVPLAPLREWIDDDPLSPTYGVPLSIGDPRYGTTVQKNAYQCTYRITNTDNLVSVLAPYSFTSLPAYQEDINIDPFVGNRITVQIPKDQSFLPNTKSIDIVFKDLQTNVHSVVRTFDINDQTVRTYYISGTFGPYNYTDAQAIAAHNDPGNPFYLYFNGWSGTEVLETIDSVTYAKQFDSIPVTSKALEVSSNRLFLANNVDGYTATTTIPQVTFDLNSYSYLTDQTLDPYLVYICIVGVDETGGGGAATKYWYTVIIKSSITNDCYLMPAEYNSTGYWFNTDGQSAVYPVTPLQNPPQWLSKKDLKFIINAPTFTGSIINDIVYSTNPSIGQPPSNIVYQGAAEFLQIPSYPIPIINVVDNAPYKGVGGEFQAFLPNSSYDYGIQFYDRALRKSGVTKIGSFNIPIYNCDNKTLYEKASVTMPSGPQSSDIIPEWAYFYSIVMSKNSKASSFVSFIPTAIKFAYKNANGLIVYDQDEQNTKLSYYGLAIPLSTLASDGIGYDYKEGDICEMQISSGGQFTPFPTPIVNDSISAPVIAVQDGYVIVLVDKDRVYNYVSYQSRTVIMNNTSVPLSNTYYGVVSTAQAQFYVTLLTPQTENKQLYEVASFGSINRSGGPGAYEFGDFYTSYYFGGSTTCFLIGDTYTQSRDGSSALVGLSSNTYDKGFQFWVENISRLCPYDRVGQKELTNQIRYSNVVVPNSSINGLSTFDALDQKSVDISAGPITTIIQSSKEANMAARMLVLCRNNTFIALIGQQQIYSQDQTTAFTSSADVLGSVTPLTGQWGCISPRAVVNYKGVTFWADAINRDIIQFAGDGATPIGQQKAAYLWQQVFKNLPYENVSDVLGQELYTAKFISMGINPYTSEIFITVPPPPSASGLTPKEYPGDAGLNRINQYIIDKAVSYVYNYQKNCWIGAYENNPDWWIRLGDDVYSVGDANDKTTGIKLYQEFNGQIGVFNQETNGCWVAFPMSEGYPKTLEPLNIILMGQFDVDTVVVYGRDIATNVDNNLTQVTQIFGSDFQMREGEMFSTVYRNRLSNGATTSPDYTLQNVIGNRLRMKVPFVQVNFPTAQQINLQGARLELKASSGH
jgi:hypothetical protein